jgi:hypothetical protein
MRVCEGVHLCEHWRYRVFIMERLASEAIEFIGRQLMQHINARKG